MKPRRTLLHRLLAKLKRPAPEPPPAPVTPRPKKRTDSSFEPLEGRIAPALLLGPSALQYTDTDGDLVTVKFSKAVFVKNATETQSQFEIRISNVVHFKSGHLTQDASRGGLATDIEELQWLNLTAFVTPGLTSPVSGSDITITASKVGLLGDDLVNVGYIQANNGNVLGLALGAVTVDGDLGRIEVGDFNKAKALTSLTVQSLGAAGTDSQAAGGTLASLITGAVGKLVVKGDVVDASFTVEDGVGTTTFGNIGSITIGGSLRVSDANTDTEAGLITAAGNIGNIKVGTTTAHGIFGGAGQTSGGIHADGKLGNITISGDLRGGAGKDSGELSAAVSIGKITLGGDLRAGAGENSGRIKTTGEQKFVNGQFVATGGDIGAIQLGSLHGDATSTGGDAGINSATISAVGSVVSFKTTGAFLGGKNTTSGSVSITGTLAKATIGASIEGGDGLNSGRLFAGKLGRLTVAHSLKGGAGASSGTIAIVGDSGPIVIGQTILGGSGVSSGGLALGGTTTSIEVNNATHTTSAILAGTAQLSGIISTGGSVGKITILGLVDGTSAIATTADGAGSIQIGGNIGALTLLGGLKGGDRELTGTITSEGTIGPIKVTGDILGGLGLSSGSIIAADSVTTTNILGNLTGGAGANSGSILIGNDSTKPGNAAKITLSGHAFGGDGAVSGTISVGGKITTLTLGMLPVTGPVLDVLKGGIGPNSGAIIAHHGIGSATILGNVTGALGVKSGTVQADGAITTLTISGALTGGGGAGSGSIQTHDILSDAILTPGNLGKLTIAGAVTGSTGENSGQIFTDGSLATLTLGSLAGSSGAASGSILIGQGLSAISDSFLKIGGARSITIKGSIAVGTNANSAVIETGGSLGTLKISGAVTGATIRAGWDIGTLSIIGAVSDTHISALGKPIVTTTDVAIGKVQITGSVSDSTILAGTDRFGGASNGSAQIGTVHITGTWTASSIVAGVADTGANGFGNGDDTAIASAHVSIISKIASIQIGGDITGTGVAGEHFGFTAQHIGNVTIKGIAQALTTGIVKDIIEIPGNPVTSDFTIREA